MLSQLIVMLTKNDRTMENAAEVFTSCKDLPIDFWGFKDRGLPEKEMQRLADQLNRSGKKAMLELVSLDEGSCLKGAKLAVRCKFRYLAGGLYFESVAAILSAAGIDYFPFCGEVSGPPIVIAGSEQQVVQHALSLQDKGVDGIDLAAFRFSGDGQALASRLIKELKIPVIMAGSIGSFERLDAVVKLKPWAFTIGSALFDGKFTADRCFRAQLQSVIAHLGQLEANG